MKLGIMQPYFFPYLGYFQLMHAVDRFVVYDDVQFIKNGWINRNRLLAQGGAPRYFTIPLDGASPNKLICEVGVQPREHWTRKLRQQILHAYARAKFKEEVVGLLDKAIGPASQYVVDYARRSILVVAEYLGLGCTIIKSSRVYSNSHLTAQARVLDICRQEHASGYINAPGGRALYDVTEFRRQNVDLAFVEPRLRAYPQCKAEVFVPGLSILDLVANLSRDDLRAYLADYEVSGSAKVLVK